MLVARLGNHQHRRVRRCLKLENFHQFGLHSSLLISIAQHVEPFQTHKSTPVLKIFDELSEIDPGLWERYFVGSLELDCDATGLSVEPIQLFP